MSVICLDNCNALPVKKEESVGFMTNDTEQQEEVHNGQSDLDDDYLSGITESKRENDKEEVKKIREKKKKMNVYICDDLTDEDSIMETTALRRDCESSGGFDNYLTMSGTIQRGRERSEKVEVVLNMSREELETLEADMLNRKRKSFQCGGLGRGAGFHVFLWSLVCLPVSFIISAAYSFCIGTITWYSIFTLFSEAKSLVWKVLVPPVLIILYPFLITLASLGLGLYAGVKQLSCYWNNWLEEFVDYEKGFYGWLCNSLDVPECSPYEVVVLSGVQKS